MTEPAFHCPACEKPLKSRKGLPSHCKACEKWDEKFDVPSSEFNFDQYFKTGLYAEGTEYGIDYVRCELCAADGVSYRKRRILDHVKKHHKLSAEFYRNLFPDAPTSCSSTYEKRKETVRENYGVDNVFQAEEIKEKFDVSETAWSDEAREKRAKTNLDRYGHENPLGGAEGYERARRGMLEAYGEENPAHVPEIQEKKRRTNFDTWGKWFVQTEEFQERYRETSNENWGEDHWMKSEDGRAKLAQIFVEKYGVDNPLKVREIWEETYRNSVLNNGGVHHLSDPKYREEFKRIWLENYGVDNPSKAPEVLERIREVWMENYGVPFPPQSLQTKFECPNKFEQRIIDLIDSSDILRERFVFTGDGKVFVEWPEGKGKNPDLVVVPKEWDGSFIDFKPRKVLEANGRYFHGPEITGVTFEQHEADMIASYAASGIECLVIWEGDVESDPAALLNRLQDFVTEES